MLENMEHRGACGCEPETGDGAGILIQTPHTFLKEEGMKLGFTLPEFGEYGILMCFMPKDDKLYNKTITQTEQLIGPVSYTHLDVYKRQQ